MAATSLLDVGAETWAMLPDLHTCSCSVFIVQEGGRPNGIAFVEFSTPQEANAAMVKNRQMMGNRYM